MSTGKCMNASPANAPTRVSQRGLVRPSSLERIERPEALGDAIDRSKISTMGTTENAAASGMLPAVPCCTYTIMPMK